MADSALSGIQTGIDTGALVTQLMAINGRRLANYELDKLRYESESEALTKLKETIISVKKSMTTLADMDDLVIFSTSTSDTDKLKISATSDATPGSHSIETNQLATAETWIQQSSTYTYKDDYVGTGTFTYSYNHQEKTIKTVDGETTLQDLVNLINDPSNNPGVSASLLYQSGKYHLILSGHETGEDYQISVNDSTTEVLATSTAGGSFTDEGVNAMLTTKITELDEFDLSAGFLGTETITITGVNNFGTSIGSTVLAVNKKTTVGYIIDKINKHFDGIATATFKNGQIYLTDHISGTSSLDITLAYNNGGGTTTFTLDALSQSTEGGNAGTLAGFEKDDFIKTLSAQNSQIKFDGYPASTETEKQNITTDAQAASGSFTLTFKGKTTTSLTYNSTVQQIEDALNALTTVTDVGGVTLTGTGFDGASGANLDINFLASAGDIDMISIDKDTLSGPTTFAITETTKGNDGWLHKNSNSISDAVSGITLILKDTTDADDPVEITVTRNTSAIASKVETMIGAFNTLKTMLKDVTEYNAAEKKMGILSKNMGVRLTKTQMITPFTGLIDGFISTTKSPFAQARDLGITIDGAGMLEFDKDVFADAIDENYNNVLELLGATKDNAGRTDSDTISFYGASDKNTTAGTYEVEVDTDALNQINAVRIRLAGETVWRETATWDGDGYITFDPESKDPNTNALLYAEGSLLLNIDLNKTAMNQTYLANVYVKQGLAGELEDMFAKITKVDGRLDTSSSILDDRITAIEAKIEREKIRLEKVHERLTMKFARMEKILTLLQMQAGIVSTFGT